MSGDKSKVVSELRALNSSIAELNRTVKRLVSLKQKEVSALGRMSRSISRGQEGDTEFNFGVISADERLKMERIDRIISIMDSECCGDDCTHLYNMDGDSFAICNNCHNRVMIAVDVEI